MDWYTINSGVLNGLWAIVMARKIAQASNQTRKNVMHLWLLMGRMAKLSQVEVSSRVKEFCDTCSGVPNIALVSSAGKSLYSPLMIFSCTQGGTDEKSVWWAAVALGSGIAGTGEGLSSW